MKQLIGISDQIYRILYNLIAGAIFLIVLRVSPSISVVLLQYDDLEGLILLLYFAVLVTGIIIAFGGLSQWNLMTFLGFKQEDGELNTHGFYSISRHPVYTGIIIIMLSALIIEISEVTILWLLGMGGYFVLGSIPEEIKLVRNLKGYPAYRNNVGRFFPYKLRHFNYLLNRPSSKNDTIFNP